MRTTLLCGGDTVVGKYVEHLPLYRLSRQYARHGVALAESTLVTWVGAVAGIFEPLWKRIGELTLSAQVLGVDDTPLKVLDRSRKAGVKRGHLWAYVGYEEGIPLRTVYRYTPDWKGEGPCQFLESRRGYIQGDGYAGIDTLFREAERGAIRVGCMAHVRRKFKDALDARDKRAAPPLELIGQLYEVERLATGRQATTAERGALRQEYSKPVMGRFQSWLKENEGLIEPKSPLGRALVYARNQWNTLQIYLQDGAVPIDNNQVEQRMRPVAVGRKNYLFCGSDAGAERAAILYTMVACCKLAGIEPFAYLKDAIERLSAGWPAHRIDELLPENWRLASPAE